MKPHPRMDPGLATLLARRPAPRVIAAPSPASALVESPAAASSPGGDELLELLFSFRGEVKVLAASIDGLVLGSSRDGVATATVPRRSVRALADHGQARYVELARRLLRPRLEADPAAPGACPEGSAASIIGAEALRRERPDLTGEGVVIGVLDSWVDITHRAFRRGPDGHTRIEALLVQEPAGAGGACAWSTEYEAARLDDMLFDRAPLDTLGHPPAVDHEHGTISLSIAAGSAGEGCYSGVAPEATLLFVADGTGADEALGSSRSVVDALRYFCERAGERACVVSISMGDGLGPHDGTSLVERAIDAVARRPGRAVVICAGNTNQLPQHAAGVVVRGQEGCLTLEVAAPCAGDVFEIWYEGPGLLDLEIAAAEGQSARFRSGAVGKEQVIGDGRFIVTSLLRASGRKRVIRVALGPADGDQLRPARYALSLSLSHKGRKRPRRTAWQAWLRDCTMPITFSPALRDRGTLSTPATCREGITVGGYDIHLPTKASQPSGRGPTWDRRPKPELLAPGSAIQAATPNTAGAAPAHAYLARAGTSVAAPQAAGAAALVFQRLGPQATTRTLRAILQACAGPGPTTTAQGRPRWGLLRVDTLLAVLDHLSPPLAAALARPAEE